MRPIKVNIVPIHKNYDIIKHRRDFWDYKTVKIFFAGKKSPNISKEDFLYLLHLLQYYKVEPTHDRKYAKN